MREVKMNRRLCDLEMGEVSDGLHHDDDEKGVE